MSQRRRKKQKKKTSASVTQTDHFFRRRVAHCIVSLLLVFIVIAALTVIAGPPSGRVIDYNPSIDEWYPSVMEKTKPDVVLLGNSLIGEGVDEQLLARQINQRTVKLWKGGWASAVWYLTFKNVVIPASSPPKTVAIFFRDHFLTDPAYRTQASYMTYIDDLAGPEEPMLERLAYLNGMDKTTYWLNQHWGLFEKRNDIKHDVESTVKSWAGSLYNHQNAQAVDRSIKKLFKVNNMLTHELANAQMKSEMVSNADLYDFNKSLPLSFLPHIVQMARDNDIQIIFIRMQRRRDAEGQSTPDGLDDYMRELKSWFEAQNVAFIDFSNEPRLKPEHYDNGDHLNRSEGRRLFTTLLAKKLQPYLQETAHTDQ